MGEHKEKATVWLFLYVKEPKQGVLRVNYSRSKTTMRREWDIVRTRNIIRTVWLFLYVKKPKQGVLRVNYSRSKMTMRREWDIVRTRNVNQPNEIGVSGICFSL